MRSQEPLSHLARSKKAEHIEDGFSLVELMAVVTIIGIIAAIALPVLNRHMAQARLADAKVALRHLRLQAENLAVQSGGAAPSADALAEAVTQTDGVTFGDAVSKMLNLKNFALGYIPNGVGYIMVYAATQASDFRASVGVTPLYCTDQDGNVGWSGFNGVGIPDNKSDVDCPKPAAYAGGVSVP